MARRSGQLIPRGERKWLVRWHVGQDPDTGKYRYSSKTIHGTKRDAQQHLNQVLRSRDLGTYVEPTRLTLNQFLDEWLEKSARLRLAPRTADDYTTVLKTYVRPVLGSEALQKIDTGIYGECESCGEAIGLKRIQARPVAELCIDCKSEQEQVERRES